MRKQVTAIIPAGLPRSHLMSLLLVPPTQEDFWDLRRSPSHPLPIEARLSSYIHMEVWGEGSGSLLFSPIQPKGIEQQWGCMPSLQQEAQSAWWAKRGGYPTAFSLVVPIIPHPDYIPALTGRILLGTLPAIIQLTISYYAPRTPASDLWGWIPGLLVLWHLTGFGQWGVSPTLDMECRAGVHFQLPDSPFVKWPSPHTMACPGVGELPTMTYRVS